MRFLKDERTGAFFMLIAACVGFIVANAGIDYSGLSKSRDLAWPFVSQIGMGLFFALIGFELRNEFSEGLFKKPIAVLVPASAALFGVILPALAYLVSCFFFAADSQVVSGWPMVTATDVSFALMLFSLLARGLPAGLRAFLLSFAVIDDILATVALAVGFHTVDALTPMASVSVALVIAFQISARATTRIIAVLSPLVAFVVLPVFAFFAMQIRFDAATLLASSSLALVVAFASRPIAKWLGVFLGAIFANRVLPTQSRLNLQTADLFRVSSMAGIGFTVSLLAADLAFRNNDKLFSAAASLTVLASLAAAAFAAIALKVRRGVK